MDQTDPLSNISVDVWDQKRRPGPRRWGWAVNWWQGRMRLSEVDYARTKALAEAEARKAEVCILAAATAYCKAREAHPRGPE